MTTAPDGARSVVYQFDTQDDPPYLTWSVTFDLSANTEVTHALAEEAMTAALGWLRQEYPGSTVGATRSYVGDLEGQAWPEGDAES